MRAGERCHGIGLEQEFASSSEQHRGACEPVFLMENKKPDCTVSKDVV